jgi:hypothetical protein
VLGALAMTTGRYLNLYPRGAHAEEVMKQLAEFFETMEGPPPPSDPYAAEVRASVRRDLAAIRAAVIKTASQEKAAVLRQIDKQAQAYR